MTIWPTTCDCGSGLVPVAVSPGDEDERLGELFYVKQGTPMRCMCLACWPATPTIQRRKHEQATGNRRVDATAAASD